MQFDESISDDLRHVINRASVSPVTVVHARVCDADLAALECGEDHVGSIERVNEIRRECACLFDRVDCDGGGTGK